MKTTLFAWVPLASAVLAAGSAGCGRSHVYPPFELFETSTGGSGGSGTSGGSATGSSGGATTGGGTSGRSSGSSGRTGSSGHSSSGKTTGNGSGSSGSGSCGPDDCQDFCQENCAPSDLCVDGEWLCGCLCGASSSGSGTSSSSSGGSSGGCSQGPPNDFSPCESEQDCSCPLACVPGPLGQDICETPCRSNSDCPILYTICQAGSCQPNLCGGLAGPPNGTLDGTCGVAGSNDGSCVPMLFGPETVGLCYQGGGSIQTCDPAATRADVQNACTPGMVCLPVGGSGQCDTLCNPATVPTTCPAAGPCVEPLSADPDLGICEPGSSSGGSSSSSGSSGGTTAGGSSGGVTGGGSSSGGGGSTGCPSSAPPVEFSVCQTQLDCGCPLLCAFDAWAGGRVCEDPCQQTNDCPDLVTVCTSQGVCQVNPCGQGTNNGTFDSTCNVLGSNDGTCIPLTNDGGASLGYCWQGGSSGPTNCNPDGTRDDLPQVCPAGQQCFGGGVDFGGTCNTICNPNQGGGCPANQFCSFIVNEPDLGICITQNGF